VKIYDANPAFEFDPEVDFEQSPAWFLDGTHSVPAWTPMFGWFWINQVRHGLQHAAEKLSLPTVYGWDWRIKNGGGYFAVLPVKSEEERASREEGFREGIRPFLEDFDGLWKGFIDEVLGLYAELKQVDVDTATNIELLDNFEHTINVTRRMWEIHMYMMYGNFTSYILFENVCRELVGIDDTDPLFHKLISGFDNKVFQVDKQLWRYSQDAKKQGLASVFLENEPNAIYSKLQESSAGRDFLNDFEGFLQEDGWRMQRMAEVNMPTWIEDPTPPLMNIKQFMQKGGDFNLDDERKKLTSQRAEAEAEFFSKVSPERRIWLTPLLRLAQKCGSFSEEHSHYLDLYGHAMIRRSCLGLGRRFAQAGAIEAADDIFFLMPDEVRKAAICPSQMDLTKLVGRRKCEWQGWCKQENPPALLKEGFNMDQAMDLLASSIDPIALKVVVGSMPVIRPELNADLHGTCGSPGVAEGIARVIHNEAQLAQIQPGDILVSATTSPSWTPVFSFIGGVVVDRGGSLSHAAIVGREYNIPVLMNVFTGTQLITTGQRIRIDANMGTLCILDN
jgi:phosphohistidine swiveling domain-containing protein